MIFEKENITFNFLGVIEFKQKNIKSKSRSWNFSAISFRFDSDVCMKTKTNVYQLTDNTVLYAPANVAFAREGAYDHLIVVHFNSGNYQGKEIEYFVSENPDVLGELFREIYDVYERKEAGYQLKCSAILYEILYECHRQNHKISPTISKIQKSVDYILGHFKDTNLTIGKIAEQSYMSEVYFRKLFKKEFGTSPQKYIVYLRIQHAAGLIATGDYMLKEVADLSGYSDYKYFSVEFKKMMGVSPSEYLNKSQKSIRN